MLPFVGDTAIAAGFCNWPAVLPVPPHCWRNVPSAANFWITSSDLFVTYTLLDPSTATPIGESSTPGDGYSPHAASSVTAVEYRTIRSFPVSATKSLLFAKVIPTGADSCPEPSVIRSVPPIVYSRTTPEDEDTHTFPDPSIAIPVAPADAHEGPATPSVV